MIKIHPKKFSPFYLILIIVILLQSACISDTAYAPVVNAWYQPKSKSGYYLVRQGDTLYSIAWAYGLDYRALAEANHLKPPYRIHAGQKISMTNVPVGKYEPKKTFSLNSKRKAESKKSSGQILKSYQHLGNKGNSRSFSPSSITKWYWPARGRVVLGFETGLIGNKGIDIAGRYGEPIRAAAKGIVVYSGAGIRGYGNLIIIKHNSSYLSAYAYNKKLLVGIGQKVQGGQQIALMGKNNAGNARLHFEIRRNGSPQDPLRYLR